MSDNQINPRQGFELSVPMPQEAGSKCYDDDGRLKRTGTVWTASAHIITAGIGSGVWSLAWAAAQLGWVAGPAGMLMFSFVTYYTATLLSACYRSGDPVTGKRNYTYTDAVRSNLGGFKVKVCEFVQYLNLLFRVAIGYTIASSISMVAIKRSNCFYKNGDKAPCHVNSNPYMIAFGVAEIIFSQIPDFDQLWWPSVVAAVMSSTYSSIGLGLVIAKVVGTVWTASAHIITAVIGSGVWSLAWATAQLGWVAGPAVMLMFSFVTYYSSTLLSASYRSGDPVTGKRNYTYTDAVRSNLGGFKVKVCEFVQYLNLLFRVAIGYTIASSISMVAIKRSNCFYKNGDKAPCHVNSNPYMIAFGVAEIIFSQIPDFDQLWWPSVVAAVMSSTYSSIGLGLVIAKVVGTVWTASAHIITAVIGSGVWSLAWATAQLGWVAGPAVMLMFSFVTYYSSTLLSACYRSGDPVTGKRNYTYTDAVRSNLGGFKVKVCEFVQYLNLLFRVAIGYTIASSISMVAIKRSNCFYKNGDKAPCHVNSNPYMIAFGVAEIIFSQIPDFDQLWWPSVVAAVMSSTYSSIGLGLVIAKVVETGTIRGSMTGIDIGTVTETQKIWRRFQALGEIAFAYSYSRVLIEIQDTVKSPPSEAKTMKKATLVSVSATTLFYMLCGCIGYAAFGDSSPRNLLTGFGFFNPYWLIDIANAAIVIHLFGAYQVSVQPLYAFVEKTAQEKYPHSQFITKDIKFRIPVFGSYNLNLFRLVWRTSFVIVTTVISMILPFFNDVVGLLGALGFWPLTVYFPVEMYIAQNRIPKWSTRWVCLQILSAACLIITMAAAAGSIAAVISDLKIYKPFKTSY